MLSTAYSNFINAIIILSDDKNSSSIFLLLTVLRTRKLYKLQWGHLAFRWLHKLMHQNLEAG